MFSFDSVDVPIRPELSAGLITYWDRLGSPGTWWTSEEKVAIASEARRAIAGETAGLDDRLPAVAVKAARMVATAPAAIRRQWVQNVVASGLTNEQYVELVGVVSCIVGIDSFHYVIDTDLEALPIPGQGSPSGETQTMTTLLREAWVPMASGAGIMFALDLVPAQSIAIRDVQSAFYVTQAQYRALDRDLGRALTRTQMELVAARTSVLNECFY